MPPVHPPGYAPEYRTLSDLPVHKNVVCCCGNLFVGLQLCEYSFYLGTINVSVNVTKVDLETVH